METEEKERVEENAKNIKLTEYNKKKIVGILSKGVENGKLNERRKRRKNVENEEKVRKVERESNKWREKKLLT